MLYKATIHTFLHSVMPDGQRDKLVHTARAVASVRDDKTWMLRYHDEENGGETVVSGTPHAITLRRCGSVTSRMVFETSRQTEAYYRTTAGEMDMQVFTRKIFSVLEAHSGHFRLDYDLMMAGETVAKNTLEVCWQRDRLD